MSIQITSSSQENFLKIQESLEKLNPKFIEKFQHAKYIMEGIDHDIELTTEFYYEETIILPENFKINRIKFNEILILSKSNEDNIEENKRYTIIVIGEIDNQKYRLIYKNRYNSTFDIY